MKRDASLLRQYVDNMARAGINSSNSAINGRGNQSFEESEKLFEKITEHISSILKINADENLLDVGCGSGRIYKELSKGRKHCAAVDFSYVMTQLALKKGAGNICQADAQALPFQGAAFNTVLCYFVFINIPDRKVIEAIIEEFARVTSPGGRILVGDIPDIEKRNFNQKWRPAQRPFDLVKNLIRSIPGYIHTRNSINKIIGSLSGKGFHTYASFHRNEFTEIGNRLNLATSIIDNPIYDFKFDILYRK